MNVALQDTGALIWLWAALGAAICVALAVVLRHRDLRRFASAPMLKEILAGVSVRRSAFRAALVAIAAFATAVALARPGWNPRPKEVQRMGRDVVFVVDVSRSMLASDLYPNRLERAKLAIGDALEAIQGDRVGLVAFAGAAVVKCPLTVDYGFFRLALDELSPDSAPRGGTLIGDAIRVALDEVFDLTEDRHRDIVLITDGDDQESFPLEAAKRAGEAGVRIIAIGLGSETQGAPIPVLDAQGRPTTLQYEGKEVLSRLQGSTLREIAEASAGGVYLNVATGNINLDEVYASLIRRAERGAIDSATKNVYDEGFQWLLGLALAALTAEALLSPVRRIRKT